MDSEDPLQEELTCPVCLELFAEPRVLPCQHSFCTDCLQKIAAPKENKPVRRGRSRKSQNKTAEKALEFECPTCKETVSLKERVIQSLPRNFHLQNITDSFQKSRKSEGKRKRDSESGSEKKKARPLMCPVHQDQPLDVYCVSCQRPVCTPCVQEGDHKDHTTGDVHAAYDTARHKVRESLALLEGRSKNMSWSLEKLKRSEEKIKHSAKSLEQSIKDQCSNLRKAVDRQEQALIAQTKAAKTRYLQRQKEMLSVYKNKHEALTKELELAKHHMENKQPVNFLMDVPVLQQKLTDLQKSQETCDVLFPHTSLSKCVDFRPALQTLQGMELSHDSSSAELTIRASISLVDFSTGPVGKRRYSSAVVWQSLEWRLLIENKLSAGDGGQRRFLSVFLQCLGRTDGQGAWSLTVATQLRILPQEARGQMFQKWLRHRYDAQHANKGWSEFIALQELEKAGCGLVNDGRVILEAFVKL
ncbi:tripartite motif-containing protein 54-like isoform X1 [Branchiostoma floridae x Branchiostoma japonicum]